MATFIVRVPASAAFRRVVRATLHRTPPLSRQATLLPFVVLVSLATIFLAPRPVYAETLVPAGTIGTNTTWTLAGSPYIVQGSLYLPSGKTLTVEPGVVVRFAQNTEFVIDGTLQAEGTTQQPIVFSANAATPQPGHWYGLTLRSGATGRFGHCEVAYAGTSSYPALGIYSSDVQVHDCTIHHNAADGISVEGAAAKARIQTSTIRDNARHAILQALNASPLYANLTLSGNGTDGVALPAGSFGPNVTLDSTGLTGKPLVVIGSVYLPASTTLTITPGTTLHFAQNTEFVIDGTLQAEGTTQQPIVFSANAATPQPGHWYGLTLRSGATGRFGHCEVAYAGTSSYPALGIYSSDVQVHDCTIHHNAADGISVEGAAAKARIQTSTIRDNARHAILQALNASPLYANLTLSGNGTDGVALPAGSFGPNVTLDSTGLTGKPLVVIGSVYLPASTTLTITPGTTLHFAQNTEFVIDGTLQAEGITQRPIVFSANATSPQPGHWYGLTLRSGATGRLGHCEVAYAGTNSYPALGIYSSDVQVHDCTLHHNAADGARIDGAEIQPRLTRVASNNNQGRAIFQATNANPRYATLSMNGNGTNAIVLQGGTLIGEREWGYNASNVPVLLENSLYIAVGSVLSLEPGMTLRMASNTQITVDGGFFALGQRSAPITITSMVAQPGAWYGVDIRSSGSAILQHCRLDNGGVNGSALLAIASSAVVVQNCQIRDSASMGVSVSNNVQPTLRFNSIESNVFGMRNFTPGTVVDARRNWWGSAPGPLHPTSNPTGTANQVSDGVLFDPWLQSPPGGAPEVGEIVVQVGGPQRASPGQSVDYAASYANLTSMPVQNAVVALTLPQAAEHVSNTPGGIYWPRRNQVFWKLGTIEPGEVGIVSMRVRYHWGLPQGLDEPILALFGGTNLPANAFDVAPYLAYVPVEVTALTTLTAQQYQSERQTWPDLNQIMNEATKSGFVFMDAGRYTLNAGQPVTEVVLLQPQRDALMFVRRQGSEVMATTFDRTEYAIRTVSGGITMSLQLDDFRFWGDWSDDPNTVSTRPAQLDARDCFFNCTLEKLTSKIIAEKHAAIQKTIKSDDCIQCRASNGENADACKRCAESIKATSGVAELTNTTTCATDCFGNPESHTCEAGGGVVVCESRWFSGFLGYRSVRYGCNNGKYDFENPTITNCGSAGLRTVPCTADFGCWGGCATRLTLDAHDRAALAERTDRYPRNPLNQRLSHTTTPPPASHVCDSGLPKQSVAQVVVLVNSATPLVALIDSAQRLQASAFSPLLARH